MIPGEFNFCSGGDAGFRRAVAIGIPGQINVTSSFVSQLRGNTFLMRPRRAILSAGNGHLDFAREIPFMSKTLTEEIDSFSEYARRHSGEGESLDVLFRRWRDQVEREEIIAAVEQGEQDAAAGLGRKVSDVFGELRHEIGLKG